MSKEAKIKMALSYLRDLNKVVDEMIDRKDDIDEKDLDSFLNALYSAITVGDFAIPFGAAYITGDQE